MKLKNQIAMKLKIVMICDEKLNKNPNGDEIEKNQIVMKCKNSKCDETQKPKLWWNSKTQVVMKRKNSNWDETKNPNCNETQNSNCYETHKLKLWWNLKTQIVMKLKYSNCVETQKH